MDNRTEVREFLASRRARLSPEQAGLTSYGSRRVPGLRRAEVAQLAGVSIEYYTRLERGNLSGVSEAVLDSLVAALQLDESERAYLFDLAKAASAPSAPRRPRTATAQEMRPSIQRLLDAMAGIPAFVRNGRLDILAINPLGLAFYAPLYAAGAHQVGQALVVRIPASLGAQDRHARVGRVRPVRVQQMRLRVEEDEPGEVQRPPRTIERRDLERLAV